MDSVPETPDPQTRTAVTRRIIAHVTRGWPRLGEPIVRHRGQFCYVSALLPGHREPTPILRLRYQGSADRWAIGIYLASSGQYTESELPASFGPKTGTPEEGVDDTFILYAGPKTGHLRPSARTRAQATKVRNTSYQASAKYPGMAADGTSAARLIAGSWARHKPTVRRVAGPARLGRRRLGASSWRGRRGREPGRGQPTPSAPRGSLLIRDVEVQAAACRDRLRLPAFPPRPMWL